MTTNTNSPTPVRAVQLKSDPECWQVVPAQAFGPDGTRWYADAMADNCTEQDAALIVSAVNSHASQSARIAELETALRALLDESDHHDDMTDPEIDARCVAGNLVPRAALAKVGG